MLDRRSVELTLLMALYALLAAAFLFFIGQDALNEQHPFQFFADSNTYLQIYAGDVLSFDGSLIGITYNYVGPLFVLRLLDGNIYLVMLLNVYLFTHSIIHIAKLLGLDPLKVVLLLLTSPLTASCLLAVNKEVFLFPFLAFALTGYMRKSILCVIVALIVSVMVRWQFAGFYVLLLLVSGVRLVQSRAVVLVGLLLVISVAYQLIQPWIAPVLANVELAFATYEGGGSGLFELTQAYQSQGLYILVFPIKAFHLLFGMGFRVDNIFNPVEIYNDLFVGGHCAVAFLVFVTMLKRRLFTLQSDLVFASVIFLAFFCVTPIFAPRYLYLGFVLWVLVLVGAPLTLSRQSANDQDQADFVPDQSALPLNTPLPLQTFPPSP